MKAERINLETEFLADMATHNGFRVEKEDHYAPQMALKPLLLGLSMLRDGIMKGSCCDYEGFVLRTASVVLTRKVSPKSKKGGMFCVIRGGQGETCHESRTFVLGISDFHPCSL